MSRNANIPDLRVTGVTPIGFQPFLRCEYQNGYIIEAGEPLDLYNDGSFHIFKFRHTEEICQWIFREMDEGRKIYPDEGLETVDEIAQKITRSKEYTVASYKTALKHLGKMSDRTARNLLLQGGYQCVSSRSLCTDEEKADIEHKLATQISSHGDNDRVFTSMRFCF